MEEPAPDAMVPQVATPGLALPSGDSAPNWPSVSTGMPPAPSSWKSPTLLVGDAPSRRLLVASTQVGVNFVPTPRPTWFAGEAIIPPTSTGTGLTVKPVGVLVTTPSALEATRL